ncbi:2-methylcitrate dehydratase [hydrothermal vent metagenome]|uniref:2-methylcitrate dehydratase n=1 Tax=hydrothermal vent metagenome TaxID=652676 RepID=A0A3B1CWH1_9ZZZZ
MKADPQSIAQTLSQFSLAVSYKHFPKKVVHEVKRRLIDTLACSLGGWRSPPAKIARKIGSRTALKNGATLLGTNFKTTPDLAAFANGTAIRYLDYNDTYLSLEPAHPSDNISAALAVAELAGANGKSLIESIVVAYEVQCRLCDAAALRPRGWDHVTYGAFSTALLSAKLLGLSKEKTVHALGLSGNANNALRQTRVGHLSMWKGAAFANTARNGVFAAELARLGMTGPAPIFEGEKGFMKIVSGPFDLPPLRNKGPFKIMNTYIKYYPVEYHAQSAVRAALNLRYKLPRCDVSKIEGIRVGTSDISYEIIGNDPDKWHPKSRETADHSLPYIVAVALMDGKVGLSQFNTRHLNNPNLSALIQKVRIFSDKQHSKRYGETMGNTVSVKISGKTYTETVDIPKGFPGNPLTDAEIEEKFHRLAKPLLSENIRLKILDQLWQVEKIKSVSTLLSLFHLKGKA